MKPLRTISILALVLLVMLSSSNFMVGIHFCSGEIRNIGILVKAEACEKEQSQPPCHRHMTATCCEDETIVHQGKELKPSVSHFHAAAPLPIDVVDINLLVSELIPASSISRAYYLLYDPPRASADITIRNQTFLI